MKTYIRRGRIPREKGGDTFFTELEIDLENQIIITIRRYTSRTYVAIKNEYKHYTKIIWKDYHDMFSLLRTFIYLHDKENIWIQSPDRNILTKQFNKLVDLPIIDKDDLVF